MRPGFTIHGPESNAGANGPIAFAHEKIEQFPRHTFTVSGAQRDKERNVDETTIGHVISDRINAEPFDVPSGVARNDDLLSLAKCRGAIFGEVGRTARSRPLLF